MAALGPSPHGRGRPRGAGGAGRPDCHTSFVRSERAPHRARSQGRGRQAAAARWKARTSTCRARDLDYALTVGLRMLHAAPPGGGARGHVQRPGGRIAAPSLLCEFDRAFAPRPGRRDKVDWRRGYFGRAMARRTKKRRAPAKPAKQPLLGSLTNDWYWEQDAAHRAHPHRAARRRRLRRRLRPHRAGQAALGARHRGGRRLGGAPRAPQGPHAVSRRAHVAHPRRRQRALRERQRRARLRPARPLRRLPRRGARRHRAQAQPSSSCACSTSLPAAWPSLPA